MRKGQKHSLEAKQKMSQLAKLRFTDPQNHPNYGRAMPSHVKELLLKTHVGIPTTLKQKTAVGFAMKGKPKSESQRRKISTALMGHKGLTGKDNPQWKDATEGKSDTTKHSWLRRHIPLPELCQMCFKVPPLDIANVSQDYHYDDPNDWIYLCRACHIRQDGRISNLEIGRRTHGSNTL